MADAFLEQLEAAIRKGTCRDLHALAAEVGVDFETICNTLNNGMLKGYFKIEVNS